MSTMRPQESIALPSAIDPQLAQAAHALIDAAGRVAILAHEHPDPDTLGSGLGLAHILHHLGKEATVICVDPPPQLYASFLPGLETVTDRPEGRFDLVAALDAGEMERFGGIYERLLSQWAGAPILNMDHHATSRGCGTVNIIDPSAAATAELLTLWLAQEGLAISRDAARCLLAGVVTDTRSFEFDATTARTMLVGAYLLARGAVPQDIIKPMYRLRSLPAARLFGLATATLRDDLDGRLVWAEITPAMWAEAGLPIGDGDEGIPNFLVDIQGAQVALLFRQYAPDEVRTSIRTTAAVDATRIAKAFGGGGHPRASGCTFHGDLAAAKAAVVAVARQIILAE
jgi:phosphoesterase RecJ-like protein